MPWSILVRTSVTLEADVVRWPVPLPMMSARGRGAMPAGPLEDRIVRPARQPARAASAAQGAAPGGSPRRNELAGRRSSDAILRGPVAAMARPQARHDGFGPDPALGAGTRGAMTPARPATAPGERVEPPSG